MHKIRKHLVEYDDIAPRTFRHAFEHSAGRGEIVETGYGFQSNDEPNINLSSIQSKLIVAAGRFASSYNADILYDIKAISDHLAKLIAMDCNASDIVAIGIRKNGADSTGAILNQMERSVDMFTGYSQVETYYHTVYAVELRVTVTEKAPHQHARLTRPEYTVTLRDITTDLYRLDLEDVTDTGKKESLKSVLTPWPEHKVDVNAELITQKMGEYYDLYQRHWLYSSKIKVPAIIEYVTQHSTLAGIKDEYGSELYDMDSFKTYLFKSEDYMKTVLNNTNEYPTYQAILEHLYF